MRRHHRAALPLSALSLLAMALVLTGVGCGNIVVPESPTPDAFVRIDDPVDAGGGGGEDGPETVDDDDGTGDGTGGTGVGKCGDDAACDDKDPCTDDSCDEDGVCQHTTAADVCDINGACYADGQVADANACKVCDTSAATDAWTDVVCSDDNVCTIDSCDPDDGCDYANDDGAACDDDDDPSNPDGVCEGGQCVSTCACKVDEDCEGLVPHGDCERAACDGCECVVTSDFTKDGEPCADGDLCLSGATCLSGQCAGGSLPDCSSAGAGACEPGVCDPETGECVTGAAGDETSCDDGDDCTVGDACDGAGGCAGVDLDCSGFEGACQSAACLGGQCVTEALEGEPCVAPNPCVTGATCQPDGQCIGAWDVDQCPCEADGDCDDGKPCTDDTCDATAGACTNAPIAGGCYIEGQCYWDGEPNLGVNACQVCSPASSQTTWSQLACDDGNDCTDDVCDPATGCGALSLTGPDCADDDPCTKDETCLDGACVGLCACTLDAHCEGAIEEVPPCMRPACINFECYLEIDPAAEGEGCEDGDLCTTGDTCQAGTCMSGEPVECDTGASADCALSECNPSNGQCQVAYAGDGTGCDDGDPCTEDDICDGAGLCGGSAKDCGSFTDACNTAACVAGVCEKSATPDESCDDLQSCTVGDVCDAAGVCKGEWDASLEGCVCVGDESCDDALDCTQDTCAVTGECVHEPKPGTCLVAGVCYDDGDSQADNVCLVCAPEDSQTALESVSCDDHLACTTDSCDPAQGCVATPNDALPCSDGDACTHDDHCDAGVCASTVECASDGDCPESANPCVAAVCQCGLCAEVPGTDGVACDDGAWCTVDDACVGGACQPGQPLDCSEAGDSVCVVGVCDDTLDTCVGEAASDGIFCSDDDACTVGDHCEAGVCTSSPKDCGDFDDQCNLGACVLGQCQANPTVGESCDDGSNCTLGDKCDPGGACFGQWDEATCGCTTDADCAEEFAGDVCNDGKCDTEAHTCYGAPLVGTACDDENACTQDDACNGVGNCAGTTFPCDDGAACTTDVCDGAGGCAHELDENTCLIDDVCYNLGQTEVDNVCQVCEGGESWASNGGETCDDGDPCTKGDSCVNGACAGEAYTCEIAACQVGVCDGEGDCSVSTAANWCFIAGSCVAAGAVHPEFECLVCDPSKSQIQWSAGGDTCDDGDPCTDGDFCLAGECQGTSYSCNDNKPCTVDTCNANDNGCGHAVDTEWCLIGTACYGEGASKPGSECELCDTSQSTAAWSPRPVGWECSDGLSCTSGDACNEEGLCSGSLSGCAALSCETPTCNPAGGCDVELKSGWCRIDGGCVIDGAAPAGNGCLRCEADTNPYAWTEKDGTCVDGDPCTEKDTCSDGTCVGNEIECDDQLACTTDFCTAAASCSSTINSGWCVIGGACVEEGTTDTTGCQWCDPGVSVIAWSPRPAGSSCPDDGLPCTLDTCVQGTCIHSASASTGQCIIGGACFESGATSPGSDCKVCDPDESLTSFVNLPSGSACTDDGNPCTNDICKNNGTCSHVGLPDYEACDDDDSETSGDWCFHGLCDGFYVKTYDSGADEEDVFMAAAPDAEGDGVHVSRVSNEKMYADYFEGDQVSGDVYVGGAPPLPGLRHAGLSPPYAVGQAQVQQWVDNSWEDPQDTLKDAWATLEPSPWPFYWGLTYQKSTTETVHAVGRDFEMEEGLIRRCQVFTTCTIACYDSWQCSQDYLPDPNATWPIDTAWVNGTPFVAANFGHQEEAEYVGILFYDGKFWIPIQGYEPAGVQGLLAFGGAGGDALGVGYGYTALHFDGSGLTPFYLPVHKEAPSADVTFTSVSTRGGRAFITGYYDVGSGATVTRFLSLWHADESDSLKDGDAWTENRIAEINVKVGDSCEETTALNAAAGDAKRLQLFGGVCGKGGPDGAVWTWDEPQ